jgi:hypothetical protein
MAISPTSFGDAKRDETGPARTNREIRARTDTRAGTNQRREVPLPHALARFRHAVRAAFRDSVGLIGHAHKHHWAEHLEMPCPARVLELCSVVAQAAIFATRRRFAKIPATITPTVVRA